MHFFPVLIRWELLMLKSNVVLITVDSLRADFVGYQNKKEKNTPFLDRLAKKSCVFANAIAPANPTFFTFCSIMTGTLPFAFGNYLGIPDNSRIKTIAEVLKEHGYATSAVLADTPALYSFYGYNKGFDYYDDGYDDSNGHPPSGKDLNLKIKTYMNHHGKEPFFLWLHYMDVHLPFSSGLDKYFFADKSSSEKEEKKMLFRKELMRSVKNMKIKDKELVEIFKEAYRACVKYLDHALEEVVNFLQKKYPNTIFVIASDHGEALMEHGMFGHEPFSLYNELIEVPMLIYVPSSKPKKIKRTASLVSLAKTITSLAGIKESQFQGDNLYDDKVYSSINNISRILYQCRSPHVRLGILDNKTEIKGYGELWSFTTPEEKYIINQASGKEEYYNLKEDPGEKKNLIQYYPQKKKRYLQFLKEYIER